MNMSWAGNEEKAVKTSLKAAEDMYMFFEKQTFAEEVNSKQKYAQQRIKGYMRDIEAFRNILKKIEEVVK